jgi:hypothetical protein
VPQGKREWNVFPAHHAKAIPNLIVAPDGTVMKNGKGTDTDGATAYPMAHHRGRNHADRNLLAAAAQALFAIYAVDEQRLVEYAGNFKDLSSLGGPG